MIALIVLGVVILLILVLLFSPIKLRFSYDDDFRLKVKYLGIKIFDTEEKPKKQGDCQNSSQNRIFLSEKG